MFQLRPITKSVKEVRKLPSAARSLPGKIEVIDEQVRNAVDDRVNPVTTDALEARGVRTLPKGFATGGAAQDL